MAQELQVKPVAAAPVAPAAPNTGFALFGADGLRFGDLFDLINPLQHVPLIGNLYRKLTGDIIDPAIRIAGGALFGGPLGAAFATASVLLKQIVNPDAATPSAVAAVEPRYESRGGWMVAASRAFPMPATRLPDVAAPPESAVAGNAPRRGGWMAQAAYAMADTSRHTRPGTIHTKV